MEDGSFHPIISRAASSKDTLTVLQRIHDDVLAFLNSGQPATQVASYNSYERLLYHQISAYYSLNSAPTYRGSTAILIQRTDALSDADRTTKTEEMKSMLFAAHKATAAQANAERSFAPALLGAPSMQPTGPPPLLPSGFTSGPAALTRAASDPIVQQLASLSLMQGMPYGMGPMDPQHVLAPLPGVGGLYPMNFLGGYDPALLVGAYHGAYGLPLGAGMGPPLGAGMAGPYNMVGSGPGYIPAPGFGPLATKVFDGKASRKLKAGGRSQDSLGSEKRRSRGGPTRAPGAGLGLSPAEELHKLQQELVKAQQNLVGHAVRGSQSELTFCLWLDLSFFIIYHPYHSYLSFLMFYLFVFPSGLEIDRRLWRRRSLKQRAPERFRANRQISPSLKFESQLDLFFNGLFHHFPYCASIFWHVLSFFLHIYTTPTIKDSSPKLRSG